MILLTVLFDRAGEYDRLLRVFLASARATMPRVPVEVLRIPAPPERDNESLTHHADCTTAFYAAIDYCLRAHETVAVCDADLMFLRPIEAVETYNFDVAVTVREHKYRCNTGLWFARPTPAARAFLRSWCRWTVVVDRKWPRVKKHVCAHGGIDQAGLAYAIQHEPVSRARVIELPCAEWNATQTEWETAPDPRVVHFKSGLRRIVIDGAQMPPGAPRLEELVAKWREYEEAQV